MCAIFYAMHACTRQVQWKGGELSVAHFFLIYTYIWCQQVGYIGIFSIFAMLKPQVASLFEIQSSNDPLLNPPETACK